MAKLTLASILALLLIGCGGGSGGGSDSNSGKPETSNTTTVTGLIDSVGGNIISVNGHNFQVSTVYYDDTNIPRSSLEENMMVTVTSRHTVAQTVAEAQVELEPTIVGQVSAISDDRSKFTVNAIELEYDNLSLEIEIYDWVLVSSLPSANAGYQVLSVVKFENSNNHEVEVEGIISNLSVNDRSFYLGSTLRVDYSASELDNSHNLKNGEWVEVEGFMRGDVLEATEVDLEDEYDNDNSSDNNAEIEGVVTWVSDDISAFQLNYQKRFTINSDTRFEDGFKAQLQPGSHVDVEYIVKLGENQALEIEFEQNSNDDWNDSDLEFIGTVERINQDNQFFKLKETDGTTTIIYVNNRTEFEDFLSFESMEGTKVEVEAYRVNDQIIAAEIEAYDAD